MMEEKFISEKQVRQRTILSFAIFILAIGAAVYSWRWIRQDPVTHNVSPLVQSSMKLNDRISSALFSDDKLAKTYRRSEAVTAARVNGGLGLRSASDTANWRLKVVRKTGDTLFLTLADLKKLPKTEVVFDFKCIEGWSQKTWWGGVKFSDFVKAYKLEKETDVSYAGLITPDRGYYVGIDMPSIMQPQTLLCYEMNGVALPMNQGFPLRLIIPVKYGIKHLKRIGTIFFSNDPPADYWAEQGYDYFSGH